MRDEDIQPFDCPEAAYMALEESIEQWEARVRGEVVFGCPCCRYDTLADPGGGACSACPINVALGSWDGCMGDRLYDRYDKVLSRSASRHDHPAVRMASSRILRRLQAILAKATIV